MTRIAPTPSGYLHPGNAANFAANALLAKSLGTGLLLRIDDLDRGRFRPEYLEDVFTVLKWLGIEPTDGPRNAQALPQWSQLTRMPLYERALTTLRMNTDRLFACPCTRKQLSGGEHPYDCPTAGISLDRGGVAWRIDTRGTELHARMPDFAVRGKDGVPSYQLACTVDDLHFGITACARGEDLRDSTDAQAMLSDLLGYRRLYDRIRFVHHPLLTDADGGKLSKRRGADSVRKTYTPEQIYALAADWLREM